MCLGIVLRMETAARCADFAVSNALRALRLPFLRRTICEKPCHRTSRYATPRIVWPQLRSATDVAIVNSAFAAGVFIFREKGSQPFPICGDTENDAESAGANALESDLQQSVAHISQSRGTSCAGRLLPVRGRQLRRGRNLLGTGRGADLGLRAGGGW